MCCGGRIFFLRGELWHLFNFKYFIPWNALINAFKWDGNVLRIRGGVLFARFFFQHLGERGAGDRRLLLAHYVGFYLGLHLQVVLGRHLARCLVVAQHRCRVFCLRHRDVALDREGHATDVCGRISTFVRWFLLITCLSIPINDRLWGLLFIWINAFNIWQWIGLNSAHQCLWYSLLHLVRYVWLSEIYSTSDAALAWDEVFVHKSGPSQFTLLHINILCASIAAFLIQILFIRFAVG